MRHRELVGLRRWRLGRAALVLLVCSTTSAGCFASGIWLPAPGEDAATLLLETPGPESSTDSTRPFVLRAAALLSLGRLNQAADAVDKALLRELLIKTVVSLEKKAKQREVKRRREASHCAHRRTAAAVATPY